MSFGRGHGPGRIRGMVVSILGWTARAFGSFSGILGRTRRATRAVSADDRRHPDDPSPAPRPSAGPVPGSGPVVAAFLLSLVASLMLAVVYIRGGQPQLEGAFLAIAFGGIGAGLVLWAKRFLPVGGASEPREPLSEPGEQRRAVAAFRQGAQLIERRRLLTRLLWAALAGIGVAAVFPIRSLGRSPRGALFHTAWRAGARAVTADGAPVRAADVIAGSVRTVFPAGFVGSADSQTLLIGLEPSLGGSTSMVAYSKVCTHAGCPVGLYQPRSHQLFCPCHQSVFDVLAGAKPVGGPAARALPQLPIAVDPDGYVVATGDFPEPVGPGFWGLTHG